MLTRRRFLGLLGGSAAVAVGAMVGAGCGQKAPDIDAPPEIRYGQERCTYCTMSIDDARFAAAWRTPARSERHFDDIGCLVNAYRREPPPADSRLWVHHYPSEDWLDANQATYVIAQTIKTPMAYGVAAFATAAEAMAAVPAARATLGWTGILSTIERKG